MEARKTVADRTKCNILIPADYPVKLKKSWTKESCYITEGHFTSPLAQHFPGLLPKESETAHFQVIVPKKWPENGRKPACLHLAGTGDHHFWRRRNLMAKPLAKEHGIASVLLENPFYGVRKPKNQLRSSLLHVVDLFVMGAALILESLVLLNWCERQGYGPLGITGISMGGHMASLACTAWPKPLAIVPCLSWSTASCVFTEGVMSKSCSWNILQQQLSNKDYRNNLLNYVPISGTTFTQFDDDDDDCLRESCVRNFSNLSSSSQSFQEKEKTNLNDNRSQTLYLKQEDIYHNLKSTFIENLPSALKKIKTREDSSAKSETVDFMNFVMDEATHLKNFALPVDPSLARFVVAKHDGYIPRDNVMSPCEIWPGCTVKYINTGHVAASLNHQHVFRKVINDTLQQLH
ncbi:hypothetical protein ACROYT_G036234 [Oculina patagonica]